MAKQDRSERSPRTAPMLSLEGKRVWVAGHRGMAGSAILRRLGQEGCEILAIGHDGLDLRRQTETEDWMAETRPEVVFLAAALVGGIHANSTRQADFLYDNLMIGTNVIHAAARIGVRKLVFLGSSCIYPRLAPQPMREEALLTGPLEPTNEGYAIAKMAGIKLCQFYRRQHGCDFITAMPSNLYGYGDNFDLAQSHVAAALMVKIHRAKKDGADSVELWGTGAPLREFLFVDDFADGVVFLAKNHSGEQPVNLGSGQEISIRGLAELLAEVIGYRGAFRFDTSKPDGTPRKIMDGTRLAALGWTAPTSLRDGLSRTYRWYVNALQQGTLRGGNASGSPSRPSA